MNRDLTRIVHYIRHRRLYIVCAVAICVALLLYTRTSSQPHTTVLTPNDTVHQSTLVSVSLCPLNHMSPHTGIYDGTVERFPSVDVPELHAELYVYGAELHRNTSLLTYTVELIPHALENINPQRWYMTIIAEQSVDILMQQQQNNSIAVSCDIGQQTYACTVRHEEEGFPGTALPQRGLFIDCPLPASAINELDLLPILPNDVWYDTMSYEAYTKHAAMWPSSTTLKLGTKSIITQLCRQNVPAGTNIVLATRPLFQFDTDRLTNWLDYHLYVGVNLITVRDRFGDIRHIVDLYQNKHTCQRIRWLPSPLPRRIFDAQIRDAVDQITWLNVDMGLHRHSASWLLSTDVDEYLYVSHPLSPTIQPSHTDCRSSILGELLDQMTAAYELIHGQLAAYYLPSVYQNAHGPAIDTLQLAYALQPQWQQSYPVMFPYRKTQTSWDRVKYIAKPAAVVFAHQHQARLRPEYVEFRPTVPLTFTEATDSILSAYPRPATSLRTNHYIDAASSRVWDFVHLFDVPDVLDISILDTIRRVQMFSNLIRQP